MVEELIDLLAEPGALTQHAGPLYQRLSSALETAMERGDVSPGTLLPPERVLAARIGVSRSTVVAAYERLREAGLVERRQGSGTRIAASAVARNADTREAELVQALHRNALFRGVIEGTKGGIDFLGSYLPAPERLSPALLAAANEELASTLEHHGYAPHGYPPLQEAIAEHLTSRGLPTTPKQVLVTNGAQQAISLATAFLVQRGEAVALENPTYPGAIDAATAVGAQLIPIPTGMDGARVSAIADILANRNPKLVYLNPTFHNPTGTVMPDAARAEVARLIERHQVVTIDDRAEAELTVGGEPPPPPIAAHAPDAPILTVGSMSKLFWGGLRVGWIRAPVPLVSRLTGFKAVLDLGTSLPGQVVATHLLHDREEVRRERRRMITPRFHLLEELLSELLPSWSWTRPKGGLLLWVRLPSGSARELAVEARRLGVAILPGPTTSPDLSFDNYVRLTVSRPPDVLAEGIRRLAAAWDDYAPRAEGRGELEVIV
jgi:DNA-binding transcriptional MocR family regulator